MLEIKPSNCWSWLALKNISGLLTLIISILGKLCCICLKRG
jgi:hypothetical protein